MEISDLNGEMTIHAEMTGPYEGSYSQTWSYDGTEFCGTDPEPSPFAPVYAVEKPLLFAAVPLLPTSIPCCYSSVIRH